MGLIHIEGLTAAHEEITETARHSAEVFDRVARDSDHKLK